MIEQIPLKCLRETPVYLDIKDLLTLLNQRNRRNPITEYRIYEWVKENKFIWKPCGKKFIINLDDFLRFLNTKEAV